MQEPPAHPLATSVLGLRHQHVRAAFKAVLVVIAVIVPAANAPAAMDDARGPAASAAGRDAARELEELGETLKAAVLSGTLSEEDAIKIYMTMERSLAPRSAKKTADAAKGADGPYAAKLDIMRLSAPPPGQIAALFQPDFLRRDLEFLVRELDLDRDQIAVTEILLIDYLESFELASKPLREALGRYWRSRADRWVAAALERAPVDDVEVALANTKEALQRLGIAAEEEDAVDETSPDRAAENAEKREARQAWAQRMVEVAATMEDRLAALRARVQRRLVEMEQAESTMTADDLVRMARELREERARLRSEFTESLEMIALIEPTDTERARFEAAVARVRIEHDLRQGRLGGESMNLWAALAETSRDDGTRRVRTDEFREVEAMLEERAPSLAAVLDDRTEATLDRELRGLEFQASHDRITVATGAVESDAGVNAARLASALQPFADASRREVAASVAVRDELLALLDESSALLDAADPDPKLAMAYRDAALRRGFRTEMRPRWSERAITAALRLDDLDDESRAALAAVASDVTAALRALRAEAVAERIRRDPERALERIEAQLDTMATRREKFDLDELLGFNHRAYTALDQRTEDQLRAILAPEQLSGLPPRPRAIKGGKGSAGGK